MQLGKINKQKGADAEHEFAKIFRDLGFHLCYPSCEHAKKYDNAKIDLIMIPFNIQIKAGRQKNLNAGKELFSMFNCIQSMFPKEDEVFKKPCLLIHTEKVGEGVVYMSLQQFNLFKRASENLEYQNLKEFRFEMYSEFKSIVSMPFEVFKNEIILKHYKNGGIRNTTI